MGPNLGRKSRIRLKGTGDARDERRRGWPRRLGEAESKTGHGLREDRVTRFDTRLAKKTGKSKAKVKRAVKKAGPSRKKVERSLGG